MWGIIFILFGILNLIIWKSLMYDSELIKAEIYSEHTLRYSSLYNYKTFIIKYIINNREYNTLINVSKKSKLYNGKIR